MVMAVAVAVAAAINAAAEAAIEESAEETKLRPIFPNQSETALRMKTKMHAFAYEEEQNTSSHIQT